MRVLVVASVWPTSERLRVMPLPGQTQPSQLSEGVVAVHTRT